MKIEIEIPDDFTETERQTTQEGLQRAADLAIASVCTGWAAQLREHLRCVRKQTGSVLHTETREEALAKQFGIGREFVPDAFGWWPGSGIHPTEPSVGESDLAK